jgi:hypothetical protein
MKLITTVLGVIILTATVSAQEINNIQNKLRENRQIISELNKGSCPIGKEFLYISSDFGKSKLNNASDLSELKNALIEKVEYVNTAFAREKKFNQNRLDTKRLVQLKKTAPWLLKKDMVNWTTSTQNGATKLEEAEKLFHGFRITFRPEYDEKMAKKEADYLDDLLTGGLPVTDYPIGTDSEEPHFSGSSSVISVISTSSVGGEVITRDTVVFLHGVPGLGFKPDSTIFNVLDRNEHWRNNIIVHDVTGSMSPYTGQVLLWHKLNFDQKRNVGYVFFNDGNNMPDRDKIDGSVGGVYFADGETIDQVTKVAKKAMLSGYGGDTPENNIEAALLGLEKFPKAKNVVMIADNWATPRDLEFAEKLTLPVKIILCGTGWGVNTKYLDLARKTGGSIHTIEKDIDDLTTMHEGETIELNHVTYKIQKGKFVKLTTF